MNYRAHWAGAALRPWQFPELEASASQHQVSLPAESDPEIATAVINEDTAIPEERSTGEIISEQIASGHAHALRSGRSGQMSAPDGLGPLVGPHQRGRHQHRDRDCSVIIVLERARWECGNLA